MLIKNDGLGSITVDPIADMTRPQTTTEYVELCEDIQYRGQRKPVLLRGGKILDGRHRHKACMQLGIDMLYEDTGVITDEEALDEVISICKAKGGDTDAGRIEAYLLSIAKGYKKKDMPIKFERLNKDHITKISYIEKENPDYIMALLNLKGVSVVNLAFDGKRETCRTINGLWKILKGNNRMKDVVVITEEETLNKVSYNTVVAEYLNNGNAEVEYWDMYNTAKENGVNIHPDSTVGVQILALIKYKYDHPNT